jgi:CRISPR-associated protein Csm3
VRDTQMTNESAEKLTGRTDLPYTEVKTEVSIDRVTSAANPRQMERVPAGAVFGQAELVYSIYEGDGCSAAKDVERIKTVFEGLQLLEDDYLGGLGTRGSGKVKLIGISLKMRSGLDYLAEPTELPGGVYADLSACVADLPKILAAVQQAVV